MSTRMRDGWRVPRDASWIERRILYEDRFGSRSDREVVPLRIAEVQGTFLMEAHCRLRGEVRCFRLDRIRAVR